MIISIFIIGVSTESNGRVGDEAQSASKIASFTVDQVNCLGQPVTGPNALAVVSEIDWQEVLPCRARREDDRVQGAGARWAGLLS